MRFKEFNFVERDRNVLDLREAFSKLSEELRQHNTGEYPEEEKPLVRQIQHILSVLGYDVGPTGVDGKYGPNTASAVAAFKSDYGLAGGGSVFDEPALQTIEKLSNGQLDPVRPLRGTQPNRQQGRRGPDDGNRAGQFTPPRSGALFTMDGASSMTRPNAADNIQDLINGPYKRMVELFGREVRINDAIARAGTSRETNTPGSQHFHGRALDLSISGMSDRDKIRLVQAAKQAGFNGFGFGTNILHVDTGPSRYWDYNISTFAGYNVAQLGAAVTRGTV